MKQVRLVLMSIERSAAELIRDEKGATETKENYKKLKKLIHKEKGATETK